MTQPTRPTFRKPQPVPVAQAPNQRRALGDWGEEVAAQWYSARGFQVVDRNWRTRHGELDLVLTKGTTLVFSEVKTRTTDRFGHPAEAVTWQKQQRIRKLAASWMAEHQARARTIRFDVVSILNGEIQVLEAAF